MIQEIVQDQEIDLPHIDPLVLDHLQFRVIDPKIFVLVIVFLIEKSIPTELHPFQHTLNFVSNEEAPYLLSFLL